MTAMSTVLKEFSDNGNSRTYTAPNHSVAMPKLVIQKRKIAADVSGISEDSVRVVFGTADSTGNPLPSKDSVEVIVRRSPAGDDDDLAAAVALAREIVASDNFGAMVSSQSWLQ